MSYEKTTWQNGDVITAEKLNNLENGVEAAEGGTAAPIMVIELLDTPGGFRFNKTFKEVFQHVQSGGLAYVYRSGFNYMYAGIVVQVNNNNNYYGVAITQNNQIPSGYTCTSEDDYPSVWMD